MNIETVTTVLCRLLEEPAFARAMRTNPSEASKAYGLSNTELSVFAPEGNATSDVASLSLRAFRLISKRLDEVPAGLQRRLDRALGMT